MLLESNLMPFARVLCINNKYINMNRKEIVCYKIMCKINNEWETPYTHDIVSSDIIKGKEDFVSDKELYTPKGKYWVIGSGFIHTYYDFFDAKIYARVLSNKFKDKREFHVFECVIPANTRHHVCKDNNGCKVYRSKRIWFVRQLASY